MARRKADYDSMMVQEFLNKGQAMAYTNFTDETKFDQMIAPWCHVYMNSDNRSKGDYFLPELRKRKLELAVIEPTGYTP